MEQYEVIIETQPRYVNEDGETKYGKVTAQSCVIEARTETEASNIARQYRTPFNNVTVSRL